MLCDTAGRRICAQLLQPQATCYTPATHIASQAWAQQTLTHGWLTSDQRLSLARDCAGRRIWAQLLQPRPPGVPGGHSEHQHHLSTGTVDPAPKLSSDISQPCALCRQEDLRTAASAPGHLEFLDDMDLKDLTEDLPSPASLPLGVEVETPTAGALGEEPFTDYLQAALDNIFGGQGGLDAGFDP